MKLKKDITFIYMDAAEKAMYKPIAEEAIKRGYKVHMTDDKFAKCEIGFYCQHINFPQFSRFSFIMLHDIIQQHSNWPDLWLREPWNKYDVGFLPSDQWVNNWHQCSQYYYANPRIGMYKVGWPKADQYAGLDKASYVKEFNEKHGLDNSKRTVLYAPSWENDGKQDDFVRAMLKLNVNILIKQASVDPAKFHDMYVAINEMNELHKDIPGVFILDPTTNIFEAIMASDILVSDESSTMCEAAMMGVPPVSVINWLIPDVTPKRFPERNYDFATETTKENLTQTVGSMLENYDEVSKKSRGLRSVTFGEIGGTAKKIMDIVDDCVAGVAIRYDRLSAAPRQSVPLKKQAFHKTECCKREVYYNYKQRSKAVSFAWDIAKAVKDKIKGK